MQTVLGEPIQEGQPVGDLPGTIPPDLPGVMQQVYQSGHPYVGG